MKSASATDHPRSRTERIDALGYDFAGRPKRRVSSCNLCGGDAFTVLAHRDRYTFAASAAGCRRCGLVFLDPVMTADAYRQFYIDVYRPLVSAFHGRQIDARTMQGEQREYAVERGDFLARYFEGRTGQRLLDIGGSTGVVAHSFCQRFGLTGTVIDPAPLEIVEAKRLGLDTVTGFVEDWQGSGAFDVVIMCQTVDHLLDVNAALIAIRKIIRADGVFFVDIVDFRAAYLRNWSIEDAVKIDHPYYLTEFTMEAYLKRAGFEVVRADFAADHLHVGYLCRPAPADPTALPTSDVVAEFWREIRHVQNAPRP